MADMTGFEMLNRLEQIPFQTVFITSYSHYAIKAIRSNALDYLLKPIDLGELRQAIDRYKKQKKDNQPNRRIQQALYNMRTSNTMEQKLTLQTQEGELNLPLKDIIRIKGERNYSFLYLTRNRKKLISKNLAEFEELLEGRGFFRCHKSHIINHVHIQYAQSFRLMTSDGTELPIARRKKEAFKSWYDEV